MRWTAAVLCLTWLLACQRPAVVIVSVDDPDGVAADAATLRLRSSGGRSIDRAVRARGYPLTLTLTSERKKNVTLEVAALDASDAPVARGWGFAAFERGRDNRLNIVLGAACETAGNGHPCSLPATGRVAGICVVGACVESECGDGFIDAPREECDDGNQVDEDECTRTCIFNECGDGIRDAVEEECDDGNTEEEDDCLSSCLANVCGDGILNPLREDCDDDNLADDDACLSTCTPNICGDGFRNLAAEACDDGNVVSGDGCSSDCQKVEICGDGLLDVGESCDDGNDNGNDGCRDCLRETWSAAAVVGLDAATADPQKVEFGTGISLATPRNEIGRVYVASQSAHTIWAVSAGQVLVVAGTGVPGFNGDLLLGPNTILNTPNALALDQIGNLFFINQGTASLRVVDAFSGVVGTIDTDGSNPESPSLTIDAAGYAYYFDLSFGTVQRTNLLSGVSDSFPGNDVCSCCDGVTLDEILINDEPIFAADNAGDVYFVDRYYNLIRRISFANPHIVEQGVVTTVGGFVEGIEDDCTAIRTSSRLTSNIASGPGTAHRTALGLNLSGLAVGPDGSVYLAEDAPDCNVRRFHPNGDVTYVFGGDEPLCGELLFPEPESIAVDGAGILYVSDRGAGRVYAYDTDTGEIVGAAGGAGTGAEREGHLARGQILTSIGDVTDDGGGGLFLAESEASRILHVDSAGVLRNYLGTGEASRCPAHPIEVPAVFAQVNKPRDLLWRGGELTFLDWGNYTVRRVDAAGGVSIVAGDCRQSASSADGTVAAGNPLDAPAAIAFDPAGTLYIAERTKVRRVQLDGTLETIMGSERATTGDCSGADAAGTFVSPAALAFGPDGSLYVLDVSTNSICRIDPDSNAIALLADLRAGGVVTEPKDIAVVDASTLVLGESSALWTVTIPTTFTAPGTMTRWHDDGAAFGYGRYPSEFVPSSLRSVHSVDGSVVLAGGPIVYGWVARVHPTLGVVGGLAGALSGTRTDGIFEVATLAGARALAAVNDDNFLVASGGTLRWVDVARRRVSTVAGYRGMVPHSHDLARFGGTAFDGVVPDGRGGAYVTSSSEGRIFRVVFSDPTHPEVSVSDPWTWRMLEIAGAGVGHADGDASQALFSGSAGLARRVLSTDEEVLYVADTGSFTIRAVVIGASNTTVTTLAGTPFVQGLPNQANPNTITFAGPVAVAVSPDGGSLVVADAPSHRVIALELDPTTGLLATGTVASIIVGGGELSGAGEPARDYRIGAPRALAFDTDGNLFVGAGRDVLAIAADADDRVSGDDRMFLVYGRDLGSSIEWLTGNITGLAARPSGAIAVVDEDVGVLFRLTAGTEPSP